MHIVQCTFIDESVWSIDKSITFPPIHFKGVTIPHEDAMVLTLGVGGFDVRIILIDLKSFTDLLQVSPYR